MDDVWSYELSSFSLSLFGKKGLLGKADKPQLANAIWKMSSGQLSIIPEDITFHYVLDGGSFLHRIIWSKGVSFKDLCQIYHLH